MTAKQQTMTFYPRLVHGRFNYWRVGMVLLTQLFFFVMPWVNWQGRQAIWFDIEHSRLLIGPWVFWPQDFIYLAALLMACAFALFLWTTIVGRVWCGYSCPQTVYSQIMLWIERLCEGDHVARRKLAQQPWHLEKILRKSARYGLAIAFCLWTGFTFVAWFSPARTLWSQLLTLEIGYWEVFWLLSYAAFTFILADRLREAVCKHMCPYARFQGVMFDRHTWVVAYDAPRGEPRRGQDGATGDCVDCGICVQVCPTGIDIRHGLQYECTSCAACIDACDQVMDKIHKPRGLIRYAPADAEKMPLWRFKTVLYSAGLLLVIAAMGWGLANHIPFKMDVLRDRQQLVRQTSEGEWQNDYVLRLSNGREQPVQFQLEARGLPQLTLPAQPYLVTVPPLSRTELSLSLTLPMDEAVTAGGHEIEWVLTESQTGQQRVEHSRFFTD